MVAQAVETCACCSRVIIVVCVVCAPDLRVSELLCNVSIDGLAVSASERCESEFRSYGGGARHSSTDAHQFPNLARLEVTNGADDRKVIERHPER